MNGLIYVALGGALGASARHLAGIGVRKFMGVGFPYATMSVNVLGSFMMGLLISFMALKVSGGQNLRLFAAVGLLGGFTTFSAFSLDAFVLFERKAYNQFALYVGGSVVLSIMALMVGLYVMRRLAGP